jgi:hypothetical protein
MSVMGVMGVMSGWGVGRYLLEPPLQCRIPLHGLLELVQCGCTNAAQLTSAQGRLQQSAAIHLVGTLGTATNKQHIRVLQAQYLSTILSSGWGSGHSNEQQHIRVLQAQYFSTLLRTGNQ